MRTPPDLTDTAVRVLVDMVRDLVNEERKEKRAQTNWGQNPDRRIQLVKAIAQVVIAKELETIRTILEEKELRIIVAWEPPQ